MVVFVLIIFIAIWMTLTFTNTLCTGAVGFGLCYKSANDPACPVCPPTPAPAPTTVSHYMPEPVDVEPYIK
jgi:hypothetical protein